MRRVPRLHRVRVVRRLRLPPIINNSQFEQLDSELTKANPDTADQIFDDHWQTWFTKADVERLEGLGINTVRIPVRSMFTEAFRISVLIICVEARLLARRTPRRRGGILPQGWNAPPRTSLYFIPSVASPLPRLQREGLGWLKAAGIAVILDHHALPGVQADNQMFAGR